METFANALGYHIADFAKLGLSSQHPVDLGSRCTVFMNSSVKQAQKEGASVEDISAGLSISIVKNAIYKVIRANDPLNWAATSLCRVELSSTMLYCAVLNWSLAQRSFVRPSPVSWEHTVPRWTPWTLCAAAKIQGDRSGLLTQDDLQSFSHTTQTAQCGLCGNHCLLTVNNFGGGRKYLSAIAVNVRLQGPPTEYSQSVSMEIQSLARIADSR